MLFRVHKELSYGASVLLTGSTKALSCWSTSNAIACKWTPGHLWEADVPSPPPPARFEFKFFVRARPAADEWEPAENHAVVVCAHAPAAENAVQVVWGAASHLEMLVCAPMFGPNDVASPPPTPTPALRERSAMRYEDEDPVRLAVEMVTKAVGNGTAHHVPPPLPPGENSVAAAVVANGEAEGNAVPDLVDVAFRIKYVPQQGERLYVVGSTPLLGEWNKMHAPRLEPVGENIFEMRTRMPRDEAHRRVEYKYFARRRDGSRRWEAGENRVAAPFDYATAVPQPTASIIWDDQWERVRVEFSIFYHGSPTDVMHITGDLPEIGAWFKPGPTAMTLGPMQKLETDVRGRKWCFTTWVDPSIRPFSYRYILIDSTTKKEIWEREPNRRGEFEADVMQPNSVLVFKDVNFVSEMMFDAVPDDLFIGPYPQTKADVDKMADGGVTAVLNLQTDEDFAHRGIQWDVLQERYDFHGIEVIRYPIRDFDRDSLLSRLRGGAKAIERLHKQGLQVYVHCTAGMGRAPACVVAYLCWVRGMSLEEAVPFVKKHRTVAVPNVPVLQEALKRPY